MDGMHTIGIHIIGKAAAAANAGNYNNIFAGYTKGRHHFLYLGQDGIITATRAPAYFLVGDKILGGKGWDCCCITHITSEIVCKFTIAKEMFNVQFSMLNVQLSP